MVTNVKVKHHRSLFQDSDLSSSDASDSDIDSNEDEDAPITASNFAARSRALDARAKREAELDAEELKMVAQDEADQFDGVEDMDDDEEEMDVDVPEAEAAILQTAEQRLEEKKSGGPDVHVVQRRMRECVRILKRWKISGTKTGRFVIQRISEALSVMIRTIRTGPAPSLSNNSFQISLVIMDIMTSWRRSYSSSFL
jgi:25S rRNA (cytosine2870-C5)-methyltransferase